MTLNHPTRGMSFPSSGAILTSPDTAVSPVGGGRPNEVLWWHVCGVEGGWVASGLADHTLTGTVEDQTLTIRASLLCPDGCGKHGFITEMVWLGT